MRARMHTVGVGGAAAVTLVTALLAGSGSSTASDVPGDDDGERTARAGQFDLQRLTDVLKNLGGADVKSRDLGGRDIDRLAALKDLRDLPNRMRDAQLGSVRVNVSTGEVEITGGKAQDRPFRFGSDSDDSSDPVIRHTSDGDAAIDTTHSVGDAARGGSYRSILVRYDRFSPAKAFIRPDAVTYDRAKVPVGAGIMVARKATERSTTVRLQVRGLLKNRTYGAHVHTKPCGAKPDDSGPHYQHRKDPVQPSTNPRYANPRNEVWLDFTTDRKGRGEAVSRHNWTFRAGEAESVVLHERGTSTGHGHAGQAGARVACFSVPLSGS
ncbi:superoxide dismutase family protein [Streptomyces sp. CA-250714]|uniref:superoxide dismutase family protein n=1 Tax=Streptomyces sp. CA-250714 TaxID=3240060 RepID=UPI003D90EBBA